MNSTIVKTVVEQMDKENAPLLQILLAVQDISPQRYISEEAVNEIAHLLNISRSRVYSTASSMKMIKQYNSNLIFNIDPNWG